MEEGLKQKYIVLKHDGSYYDENAEFFVLRLDEHAKDQKHVDACRKALMAYANEIETHIPELARDLRNRYGKST